MEAYLKLENTTTKIALILAITFLIIATCLALYQVTTRFVFGHPSVWSETITRSAMIWSVFLGVPAAYQRGGMISIEVMQTTLPQRAGIILYIVANTLSLIFFTILFWQGYQMTLRVMSQKLAGLPFSIAWAYAALPIGAAFSTIAVGACIIRVTYEGQLPGTNLELEA